MRRKVLVFGAGVIGAYLIHVLTEAGNDVTVLAREQRADSLNRNGLVIYHHLQKKTTKDEVKAVTDVSGMKFDAAFVVMPYHKLLSALPTVYGFETDLLVLVGNDLSPSDVYSRVQDNAPGVKKIMFGFQVSGGKKEADSYICERFAGSWMDVGYLHGPADDRSKAEFESMFKGTKYKINWKDDMDSYLLCHPAAILPIAYLSYICGGDLRKSTRNQRKTMYDASHEAYEFLKSIGITDPSGDDKFYLRGPSGTLMKFLYFIMAKSVMGDLVACEHCRNSVSEMEQIDLFYTEFMKGYPESKLTSWNSLKRKMPSWEELHRLYGN